MTFTKQDKDALSKNWDQAKSQIKSQFSGVTDDDLEQGRSNPDQLASTIATRTGQDQATVEQSLHSVAQQYGGNQ